MYRPRPATAKVAAFVCAGLLAVSISTGSRNAIWLAAVPFLFFVQCFQRVEVSGNRRGGPACVRSSSTCRRRR